MPRTLTTATATADPTSPPMPYLPLSTHGLLTLLHRDLQPGLFGQVSNGYWVARCQCGTLVTVNTRDLRLNTRRAYSCSSCPPPPRRLRSPTSYTGRPPLLHLLHQPIGRLTPISWTTNLGWECVCYECGGIEVARTSSILMRLGAKKCGGTCTPPLTTPTQPTPPSAFAARAK